jgi:hypothetical protein
MQAHTDFYPPRIVDLPSNAQKSPVLPKHCWIEQLVVVQDVGEDGPKNPR